MRIIFITLFIMFLQTNLHAVEILTNENIIQMKSLGLSEEIIIMKINSTEHDFDTSLNELGRLQKKGISNNIVKVMMSASMARKKAENKLPSGDLLYKINGVVHKLTAASLQLENSNRKRWVPFANSAPETFLYFSNPASSIRFDNTEIEFLSRIEPNRIQLVKLGYHNGRETRFIVFQNGNSDRIQSFSTEALDDGIYKLRLSNALVPGEYAFMIKPDMRKLQASLGGFAQLAMNSIAPSIAYDFAINGVDTERSSLSNQNNDSDEDE